MHCSQVLNEKRRCWRTVRWIFQSTWHEQQVNTVLDISSHNLTALVRSNCEWKTASVNSRGPAMLKQPQKCTNCWHEPGAYRFLNDVRTTWQKRNEKHLQELVHQMVVFLFRSTSKTARFRWNFHGYVWVEQVFVSLFLVASVAALGSIFKAGEKHDNSKTFKLIIKQSVKPKWLQEALPTEPLDQQIAEAEQLFELWIGGLRNHYQNYQKMSEKPKQTNTQTFIQS